MSTHKTDVHGPYRKLNHCHKPVIVSTDIEHIVLVSHTVRASECLFHIGKTSPLCLTHFLKPFFQCRAGIGIVRVICNERTSCNDSHITWFVCKYTRNRSKKQNNLR